MSAAVDITNQRFNKLVAVRCDYTNGTGWWLFRCDCGSEVLRQKGQVLSGRTWHCGCEGKRTWTWASYPQPGHVDYELYKIWRGMRDRCNNPNLPGYKYYGARGIKVCVQWQDSFENFKRDIGPRPSPKHSINRINNDGDYMPENCNWATQSEQILSRRK